MKARWTLDTYRLLGFGGTRRRRGLRAARAPEPVARGRAGLLRGVARLLRVVLRATPSADSDIRIEVWMPAAGWNGRFRGQGNGGFSGEIDHRSMGAALVRGDATAGTDTGHTSAGIDAAWALGHPEKVTDFGYRAIHTMTTVAKAVIRAHYVMRQLGLAP